MSASRNKGNKFESKIAKIFSERFKHITKVEKGFYRNLKGSGAFTGGKNAFRVKQFDQKDVDVGDITTPLNFKYTIECKHYKSPITLKMLIEQKCAFLDKWIEQVEIDANSINKKPMIIAKFNLIPEILLVKENIQNIYFAKYKKYFIYDMNQFINLGDSIFFNNVNKEKG